MPKSDRSIILFTVVCVVLLAAILLACILLPRQGGDSTPTPSLSPEEVVAEYKGQAMEKLIQAHADEIQYYLED